MLVLGEIHCALLPHSRPLTPEEARAALSLAVGENVTQWARPIPHTASAALLHGVDCRLALGPKPNKRHTDEGGDNGSVRAVGTVSSRAVLNGGHILLGSAWASVEAHDQPRRMPWSYYLARPGTVYPIGKLEARRLAMGFLRADVRSDRSEFLDPGALARHPIRDVHNRPGLDHRPPFRTGPIRLRWAAITDQSGSRDVEFRLVDTERRRLLLTCGEVGPEQIAAAAEELAVHEWLVTAVSARIALARIGEDSQYTLKTLRPLVDHLLHLWSPRARTVAELQFVWDELERRPGLSHQWNTMVERVRGQIDYGAADLTDRILSMISQNPQLWQRGENREY